MTRQQKTPDIFLSMRHPCSYLPGRTAATLFVDPRHPFDGALFDRFMQHGFRRSGDLVYRPHCPECNACVPVRIPVQRFRQNRSQRRIWQRNADLSVRARPAEFDPEHFALYEHYLAERHRGGGMDVTDPQKYVGFLVSHQVETVFYEMRAGPRLLAVAVADRLPSGLSAVYTFFDPDERTRGLGVYAILWQIEEARRLRGSWLYLGYWIEECQKMAYKIRYQPLEAYLNGRWVPLTR